MVSLKTHQHRNHATPVFKEEHGLAIVRHKCSLSRILTKECISDSLPDILAASLAALLSCNRIDQKKEDRPQSEESAAHWYIFFLQGGIQVC